MPPILTQVNSIILEYPDVAPTNIITLHSPDFGNTHELALTRIQRESRGLTQQTFIQFTWPKSELLKFVFTNLPNSADFINFLEISLGKLIKLTDYESRVWVGIIINPNDATEELIRNCGYKVSFIFQGSLS